MTDLCTNQVVDSEKINGAPHTNTELNTQRLTNRHIPDYSFTRKHTFAQPKSQQNDNVGAPQTSAPINPQRPLTRIDSRGSFPFRPPFPNQPGSPARPISQPLRQAGPPGQQFVPRNSAPAQGAQRPQLPPQHGQPNVQTFPPNQQRPPPTFRPATPFPRPGVPNQRLLFQQRSAPGYGTGLRASVPEETLARSQTLDPSEIDISKTSDDNKNTTNEYVKTASIAAMNNRSYSLSSNPPEQVMEPKEEPRRRSVSSADSFGEGRIGSRPSSRQGSISGSSENLDKKQENDIPSRPESRNMSRMNKIMEDEDRSPSSLTDISQKSPDLSNISDSISKSQPTVSKTPDSISSNKTPEGKMQFYAREGASQKQVADTSKASKPTFRSEGDNDSGVDESTQEKSSNGETRSPRKMTKSPRTSSTTPARSLSRGSKSPSLKSPDSNATTPGSTTEKKKVPMNKIQVGAAPSPNLKTIKSKIGSLDNASYKPGGGKIKIESKKLEFKVGSRIEAKNDKYMPKGGDKKITQQKLVWNAKSKVGSLENASHKPKGGDKKIESVKLDFKEKAKPKVGSKDNLKHTPGGGEVKSEDVTEDKDTGTEKNTIKVTKDIETKKIELNVSSKVGSLDNVKHKPGGGDKKIFDDKDYLKQKSVVSSIEHSLSGSQNSLPSQPDTKQPVADENLNQEH